MGSKEVYLLPQHGALQTARRSPVCDFPIIAAIAPVSLGLPKTLSWCTWAQARLDGVEKCNKPPKRQGSPGSSSDSRELVMLDCRFANNVQYAATTCMLQNTGFAGCMYSCSLVAVRVLCYPQSRSTIQFVVPINGLRVSKISL